MTSSSNQSGETTRIFDNVARGFFSKVAFAVPKKAKSPAAGLYLGKETYYSTSI